MSLLAPDILEEARGLSPAAGVTGLLLGLFIWLLGWRGHRFWIVLATTVAAGLVGLSAGPSYGTSPLVAGVLLAVAAGVLALALVRMLAFVAGGLGTWMTIHALLPTWNEPLVCFLIGGLVGLFMFRFWTIALTSFVGAMLMSYSGLCLAEHYGKLNAVALAQTQPAVLNWTCLGTTLAGIAVQFVLERRRGKGKRDRGRSSRPRDDGKEGGFSLFRSFTEPMARRAG